MFKISERADYEIDPDGTTTLTQTGDSGGDVCEMLLTGLKSRH